jgi:hypothetical protein
MHELSYNELDRVVGGATQKPDSTQNIVVKKDGPGRDGGGTLTVTNQVIDGVFYSTASWQRNYW